MNTKLLKPLTDFLSELTGTDGLLAGKDRIKNAIFQDIKTAFLNTHIKLLAQAKQTSADNVGYIDTQVEALSTQIRNILETSTQKEPTLQKDILSAFDATRKNIDDAIKNTLAYELIWALGHTSILEIKTRQISRLLTSKSTSSTQSSSSENLSTLLSELADDDDWDNVPLNDIQNKLIQELGVQDLFPKSKSSSTSPVSSSSSSSSRAAGQRVSSLQETDCKSRERQSAIATEAMEKRGVKERTKRRRSNSIGAGLSQSTSALSRSRKQRIVSAALFSTSSPVVNAENLSFSAASLSSSSSSSISVEKSQPINIIDSRDEKKPITGLPALRNFCAGLKELSKYHYNLNVDFIITEIKSDFLGTLGATLPLLQDIIEKGRNTQPLTSDVISELATMAMDKMGMFARAIRATLKQHIPQKTAAFELAIELYYKNILAIDDEILDYFGNFILDRVKKTTPELKEENTGILSALDQYKKAKTPVKVYLEDELLQTTLPAAMKDFSEALKERLKEHLHYMLTLSNIITYLRRTLLPDSLTELSDIIETHGQLLDKTISLDKLQTQIETHIDNSCKGTPTLIVTLNKNFSPLLLREHDDLANQLLNGLIKLKEHFENTGCLERAVAVAIVSLSYNTGAYPPKDSYGNAEEIADIRKTQEHNEAILLIAKREGLLVDRTQPQLSPVKKEIPVDAQLSDRGKRPHYNPQPFITGALKACDRQFANAQLIWPDDIQGLHDRFSLLRSTLRFGVESEKAQEQIKIFNQQIQYYIEKNEEKLQALSTDLQQDTSNKTKETFFLAFSQVVSQHIDKIRITLTKVKAFLSLYTTLEGIDKLHNNEKNKLSTLLIEEASTDDSQSVYQRLKEIQATTLTPHDIADDSQTISATSSTTSHSYVFAPSKYQEVNTLCTEAIKLIEEITEKQIELSDTQSSNIASASKISAASETKAPPIAEMVCSRGISSSVPLPTHGYSSSLASSASLSLSNYSTRPQSYIDVDSTYKSSPSYTPRQSFTISFLSAAVVVGTTLIAGIIIGIMVANWHITLPLMMLAGFITGWALYKGLPETKKFSFFGNNEASTNTTKHNCQPDADALSCS